MKLPHNKFDQYVQVVGPVRSGFFDIICPVTGFKSQDKKTALFIAALSFLKLSTQKGEVGHFPATAYQMFASQTVYGQAKWCVSCLREGCRSRFATMLVHHFHAYGCWTGDISDELMTAVLFKQHVGNVCTRGMYPESAVPKLLDCLPRF